MRIGNAKALALLQEVSDNRSSAFGGLGLIFYLAHLELPVLALGPRAGFPHSLPVFGGPQSVGFWLRFQTLPVPGTTGFIWWMQGNKL